MKAVTQATEGEKPTYLDTIVEMARKEIYAIRNIDEVNFNDFFQSRIERTKADSTLGYKAKVAIKTVLKPAYYIAFKSYQFFEMIPDRNY